MGERALVKLVEQEEKTTSGIVLLETVNNATDRAGRSNRRSEEVEVSEGDLVVFAKYSGGKISLDSEDCLILDSADLLGVVKSSA